MSKEELEANRIVEIYIDTLDWGTPLVIANRCALIHVQGIIEETDSPNYWQKVKEIIESK